MTAGSHVPGPFLDPRSDMLGTKSAEYAPPYCRVHIPVEAPARTKAGEVSTHPIAVLFPGTMVGQFGTLGLQLGWIAGLWSLSSSGGWITPRPFMGTYTS